MPDENYSSVILSGRKKLAGQHRNRKKSSLREYEQR